MLLYKQSVKLEWTHTCHAQQWPTSPSDSGWLQKHKKTGVFKSWAFVISDMEADDDAHLKPLTNDDDDKEMKGGKLLSVTIYSYFPS